MKIIKMSDNYIIVFDIFFIKDIEKSELKKSVTRYK